MTSVEDPEAIEARSEATRMRRAADLAAVAARRWPWHEDGPGIRVVAASIADTLALLEGREAIVDLRSHRHDADAGRTIARKRAGDAA
ncbi:MAG: hypothetical protein AB7G37_18080 [Solirubrobacteraceae bacterium]